MKILLKTIKHIFFIVLLTILTQVGGIAYIINEYLNKKRKTKNRLKSSVVFLTIYSVLSFVLVPIIAPFFGREKVSNTESVSPTNYMTIILNRNYVHPEVNELLAATQKDLAGTGIEIHYLDASFPFIDGFPLLPHLSHNDGKKLDLSLIYQTSDGKVSNKQKSRSGYGVFEAPKPHEIDKIQYCLDQGCFQYDYPKFLTLGATNDELEFSLKGTKKLILSLLKNKNLEKVFIEPHLKSRMNLSHPKIRYHGCRAVRHDDHIHLQVK